MSTIDLAFYKEHYSPAIYASIERATLASREAEALLTDPLDMVHAAEIVSRLSADDAIKTILARHVRRYESRPSACMAITKCWTVSAEGALQLIKKKLPQAIEALYGVPADETKAIIYPLVTEEQIRSLNEETVAFNEMIRLHKATMV